MTEEATAQVVEVGNKVLSLTETALTEAMEYVRATADFIGDQAPLLVQEVLAYGLAYNAIWAVVCALVLGGLGYGWWKTIRTCCINGNGKFDGETVVPVTVLALVLMLAPMIAFVECSFNAVKISVAPRLYLMEFFSDLIK